MKIAGIRCLKCGDFAYSRARHDMHACSCGNIHVDGGFEYIGVTFVSNLFTPETMQIKVTKETLQKDWATRRNKYGLVKFEGTKGELTAMAAKKLLGGAEDASENADRLSFGQA